MTIRHSSHAQTAVKLNEEAEQPGLAYVDTETTGIGSSCFQSPASHHRRTASTGSAVSVGHGQAQPTFALHTSPSLVVHYHGNEIRISCSLRQSQEPSQ